MVHLDQLSLHCDVVVRAQSMVPDTSTRHQQIDAAVVRHRRRNERLAGRWVGHVRRYDVGPAD